MGNRDNFGKCRSCGQQVIWIKTVAGKNMPCNPQLVTYRQGNGKEKIVTPNGEVLSGEAGRRRNAGRNRCRLHITFRYLPECRKPQEEVRKQVFSMKVELDKTGMVHLVSGTYPSHDMQEALQNRNLGYRENDVWHWDSEELRKLDNPQLYTLYKELRY